MKTRLREWHSGASLGLALCGAALILVWSARISFPYLDPEGVHYLLNNLRSLPLLANIFDIQANDYGVFRARELSYFFNILDAQFIHFSFALGLGHFLSLVHFVCLFVIGTLQWQVGKRVFRLPALQNTLLVLIFLSSAVVFLSPFYFRTSKILVALCAQVIAYSVITDRQNHRRTPLCVGLVALACALCDEQGVFVLVYFALVSGFAWAFTRERRWGYLLGGLIAAALVYSLYRLCLGPWAIASLGKVPLDSARQAPFQAGESDFKVLRDHWSAGAGLTWNWIRFALGSNSYLAGALVFLVGGLGVLQAFKARWLGALFVGASIVYFILGHALMVGRHPALSWGMVQRVYYGLPFTVLILVALTFAVAAWNLRTSNFRRAGHAATAVLGLILLLNLLAIPNHLQVRVDEFLQKAGRFDELSTRIRDCVEKGPPGAMDPSERQLCERLKL